MLAVLLVARRLWLAWVFVGVWSWSTAAAARPSADRIARMRAEIARILEQAEVVGAGIALVDTEGVIWAGGVGLADRQTGREVDDRTLFRVASVSKSFVALAAAQLHERGALSLDAPLRQWLPGVEIDNPWEANHPVTLAQALEHTAGFDDMRFNETFAPPRVESLPLLHLLRINPRSRRVRWRPGSRAAYANPGYTVAAAGIERASGVTYERFIADEILRPLGFERWAFRWDSALEGQLAQGYVAGGVAFPYQGLVHRPAGSMMLGARDLGRFVHYWLTRGRAHPRLANAATLRRIETAATLSYPPPDASYGLGNYADVTRDAVGRGHDGGLPGFASAYRYYPELGVGYVVLLNSTHLKTAAAKRAIGNELLAALREDAPPLPPPPVVDLPAETLDRLTGEYAFANPRHQLFGFLDRLQLAAHVERHNGRLRLRIGERSQALLPVTATRFRFAGESGASVVFSADEDGAPIMVAHGAYFERSPRFIAALRLASLRWAIAAMEWIVWALVLVFVGFVVTRRRTGGIRAPEVLALALPALAAGCLWAWGSTAAHATPGNLAVLSTVSGALFGLSIAFAAVAVASLAASLYLLAVADPDDGAIRLPFKLAPLLASLGACWLAGYGYLNDLIGLRTWMW